MTFCRSVSSISVPAMRSMAGTALFMTLMVAAPLSIANASAKNPPAGSAVFDWQSLPPLPKEAGKWGSFAGTSNGALIVAGGTGPEKLPTDEIWVLETSAGKWKQSGRLPYPLSHGVSVSTARGLICLGGSDGKRHRAEVFRLEHLGGRVAISTLPPMPAPTARSCGLKIGNTLFIAGGLENPDAKQAMANFWAIDLTSLFASTRGEGEDEGDGTGSMEAGDWSILNTWPGSKRMSAVAGSQQGLFFLFGGEQLEQGRRSPLADAYCYDPTAKAWTEIAAPPFDLSGAPSPAAPLGKSHLAILGGSDEICCYHTITNTWITVGRFYDEAAPSQITPVRWRNGFVLPGGRLSPDRGTTEVLLALPKKRTHAFGWLDYTVVAIYMGSLIGMGIYFSRREKSTGDFFIAGRRIPWWAAGMSIFGTQLSAITFMAVPAMAYATNWAYSMENVMIVLMVPVVVCFYIPFYQRLRITSAYEYLEKRFNTPTRLLASLSFIMFQFGRMGIVLFLPALALSTVTGTNIYWCILAMGVLATCYTAMGGIEAVIWTDVVQVAVLLGGALLCLIIMVLHIDGGLACIFSEGLAHSKLQMAALDGNATQACLWVIAIGAGGGVLVSYTSDQAVIQRYLTTADEKAAARGLWTSGLLTIPATILFFGLGTALWAFYRSQPQLLNPTGQIDDIFPWFIANQLPAGLTGLVIAGIFAASMSSLDSSINSVTTAITVDFYHRFLPNLTERAYLGFARAITVLLGGVGTACGCLIAYLNNPSMWDQYLMVLGLFGGGLCGLFMLGIFTCRAHGPGALVGFFTSAAVLAFVIFAHPYTLVSLCDNRIANLFRCRSICKYPHSV